MSPTPITPTFMWLILRSRLRCELAAQERAAQAIEFFLGIPLHEMLAIGDDMQDECGLLLLQRLRALAGLATILAAVNHQHWLLHVAQALPHGLFVRVFWRS